MQGIIVPSPSVQSAIHAGYGYTQLFTQQEIPSTMYAKTAQDHSIQEQTPAERDEYKIYPQLMAVSAANLASLHVGMSFGWVSPSLPILQDPSSDLQISSNEGSWLASAMRIGACIGPLLSGLLVNRIGRKWFLYATGVPTLLSWIITYFAGSFLELIAARFINGLGVGGILVALPIYVSEISETGIRGGMGNLLTVFLFFGNLVSYSVGPWVDRKVFAIVNMIPVVLFLLLFIWVPETPYYYLTKNRQKSAEESLSWLRGTTSIKVELEEMSTFIQDEMKHRGQIKELLTVKANRRASLIALLLFGLQQVSGEAAILAYIGVLFKKTFTNFDSSFGVIIVGAAIFLSNATATCLIDKVGRKLLILISGCCVSVCLFIVSVYYHAEAMGVNVDAISWIPLVGIVMFNVTSAFGLHPVPYIMTSELYPTSIKAWAITITSIYGSLLGVAVTIIYQGVSDEYGEHVIFYGLCAAELVLICLAFFVIPETKGKSFKEIQDILNGETKATANYRKNNREIIEMS